MISVQYNEPEIIKNIECLPLLLRVAFAALCAERLLPAYIRFCGQTGTGDAQKMEAILGRVWRDIAGEHITNEELQAELDACMSLIPQEDEGEWIEQQAYAEDAGAAVAYALRARKSGEPQEAAWAARCAYETLHYYLTYQEGRHAIDPGEVERTMAHPIVQAELLRQKRDLDDLAKIAKAPDWQLKLADIRSRAESDAAIFFGPPDA
jgi:uncharacterized protein YjaG (DUF416 family)